MKFIVIVVQLLLFINIVKSTSLEEDSELERRLDILNKPPIKTFKDEDGSIVDCINIHKQPALDHPLLKNHKIQMRPTSLPDGMTTENKIRNVDNGMSKNAFRSSSWECPSGTVPFRRTTKEDLIKAKAALDQHTTAASTEAGFPLSYAGVITSVPENNPGQQIYGSKVHLSVYNLTNIVSPQTSSAFLLLGNSYGRLFNYFEFGWTANPQLYGDTKTRTYSYWTTDGYQQKTGCFNAQCPGYVQVSRTTILGLPIDPVSVPGQQSVGIGFVIFKDPKTGNWWLSYMLSPGKYEQIGYWPKELLPMMQEYANDVTIGGKVFSPDNMTGKPQMGSGVFVKNDITRTCYASNIEFVNSTNQFYAASKDVFSSADYRDQGYTVDWFEDKTTEFGYDILFGGPN